MRTRLLVAIGLAMIIAGCKREPAFDERYDDANRAIVERAKRIDAEIAATGAPQGDAEDTAPVP